LTPSWFSAAKDIGVIHPDELALASLPTRIVVSGDPRIDMNDNPQSIDFSLSCTR
jgi:hypothetical protein